MLWSNYRQPGPDNTQHRGVTPPPPLPAICPPRNTDPEPPAVGGLCQGLGPTGDSEQAGFVGRALACLSGSIASVQQEQTGRSLRPPALLWAKDAGGLGWAHMAKRHRVAWAARGQAQLITLCHSRVAMLDKDIPRGKRSMHGAGGV